MGDSAQGIGGQTGSIMAALEKYAPGAIQAISQTIPGVASQVASGDAATAGTYNQLYNTGQLASANTEAQIASGPGMSLVASADKAQRTLDPEYYAQRALLNDSLTKYLTSYDPTKLTPTEEAQIARGVNATSGSITPSNMQTIRNAQTFGSAGTQRWQNFGDALTKAYGALPGLRSGLNGFNIATQRGANPGGTGTLGIGSSALGNSFGFANNALGNITAMKTLQQQIDEANSPMNLALKSTSALGNIVGAAKGASGIGT